MSSVFNNCVWIDNKMCIFSYHLVLWFYFYFYNNIIYNGMPSQGKAISCPKWQQIYLFMFNNRSYPTCGSVLPFKPADQLGPLCKVCVFFPCLWGGLSRSWGSWRIPSSFMWEVAYTLAGRQTITGLTLRQPFTLMGDLEYAALQFWD